MIAWDQAIATRGTLEAKSNHRGSRIGGTRGIVGEIVGGGTNANARSDMRAMHRIPQFSRMIRVRGLLLRSAARTGPLTSLCRLQFRDISGGIRPGMNNACGDVRK